MSRNLLLVNHVDTVKYTLSAFIANTWDLSLLLGTIHFKDTATICASEDGVKVTVEDFKCVQASVFIPTAVFEKYEIKEDFVIFKVNLSILLQCLNIFGTNNIFNRAKSLQIFYAGYGSPLILLLEEHGVVTECKLKTLEADEIVDLNFSSENVVNKLVMKSEYLKEAWMDLDMTSDSLSISLSPVEPYFQLDTKGTFGDILIKFSKDSEEIECFQVIETQQNSYRIAHLKPSLKALQHSIKFSLRTDNLGILCLQYMVKLDNSSMCFIEYICVPDVAPYEDDCQH